MWLYMDFTATTTFISCMLFVNVEYQRHLYLSSTTLILVSFPTPFQELQNDAKISRKKHWPAYKLLENTIQESWFYRFLPLLSLFSSIKVNTLYFKSMIFGISSQNWVYTYHFHSFFSIFIFFEKFACTPPQGRVKKWMSSESCFNYENVISNFWIDDRTSIYKCFNR